MSEPTIKELTDRISGILHRNLEIEKELTPELKKEMPTYAMFLELEVPLNDARLIMARAYLDLIQSRKSNAPKPCDPGASSSCVSNGKG